nr:hypothetical protein [Nocardiopsis sp. CNR-923]
MPRKSIIWSRFRAAARAVRLPHVPLHVHDPDRLRDCDISSCTGDGLSVHNQGEASVLRSRVCNGRRNGVLVAAGGAASLRRCEMFGNARYARQVMERMITRQAGRLVGVGDATGEDFTALLVEDIP